MIISERQENFPSVSDSPNNSGAARVPLALIIIFSLAGLTDAVYLTAEHLAGRSLKCTVVQGCEEVLSSPYATLPGHIPLAALGGLAYFTVFSLAVLALFGYTFAARLLPFVVGAMFLFTLWLLYVQAFILNRYCQYCLLSALFTFGLTASTIWLFAKTKTESRT